MPVILGRSGNNVQRFCGSSSTVFHMGIRKSCHGVFPTSSNRRKLEENRFTSLS